MRKNLTGLGTRFAFLAMFALLSLFSTQMKAADLVSVSPPAGPLAGWVENEQISITISEPISNLGYAQVTLKSASGEELEVGPVGLYAEGNPATATVFTGTVYDFNVYEFAPGVTYQGVFEFYNNMGSVLQSFTVEWTGEGADTPPVVGDVTYSLAIDGASLSTVETTLTPVSPGFSTVSVTSTDGEITLGEDDEYGNPPTGFIGIYGVNDPDHMSVGGVESYNNGVLKLWDPFEGEGNYYIEVGEGVFLINGVPAPAMKFYFTTGEEVATVIEMYISGAFNEYAEAGNSQWQLAETGEGTKVYTGTFDVAEGEFEFNLQSNEGVTYVYDGEGVAPGSTGQTGEEDRPGVMIMPVSFASGAWTGQMQMAMGGDQFHYWANETWNGGSITVTADLGSNTITITGQENAPAEPTYMGEGNVIYPEGTSQYVADLSAVAVQWNETLSKVDGATAYPKLYINGSDMDIDVPYELMDYPFGDPGVGTGNTIYIDLEEYTSEDSMPKAGTYKVVIPAGIVENSNGDLNPEQTITRTVLGTVYGKANPDEYTLTEGEYQTITVTFPGSSISINEAVSEAVTVNDQPVEPQIDGASVIFNIEDWTAGNEYSIVIPGQLYIIDNTNYNAEFTQSWEVEAAKAAYMEPARLLNPEISGAEMNPAVELTWGQTVELVSEDFEIKVSLDGTELGVIDDATLLNLVPSGGSEPGIATLADAGDQGELLYVLFDAAGYFRGEGTYTFEIPEGLVQNAAGEINPAQTVTIIASGLVEGTVTPEEGAEFKEGENVTITISYEGATIETNYSEDAPLMVTDYDEYDKQFTWADTDVLKLDTETKQVVITLGNALKAGTYYVTFREGMILVDGVQNGSVDYMFTVVKDSAEPEPGEVEAIEENVATPIEANTLYTFTPSADGTLTVTSNSFSNFEFLYSDADHSDLIESSNVGYGDDGIVYTYEGLQEGVTYYVYVESLLEPLPEGFELTFSMDSAEPEPGEDNVIKENVATPIVANTLYTFTPSADGTLTVTSNSFSNFEFLYSDADHSDLIESSNVGYGDDGIVYTYEGLQAGVTYYVYIESLLEPLPEGFELTFSMNGQAGSAAEITAIDPAPGKAFDVENYGYSQLTIVPEDVTFSKVTVEYWIDGNDTATVVDITPEQLNGTLWGLPIKEAYMAADGKVAANTNFVVNIEGLTYNGEPVVCNIDGVTSDGNGNLSYYYTVEAADSSAETVIGDAQIVGLALNGDVTSAEISWYDETDHAYTVALNDDCEEAIEILPLDANYIMPKFTVEVNDYDNALVIVFAEPLAKGTYSVYVPEGYVILGEDAINAGQSLQLIVDTTGIPGVIADANGNYTVYNMNGSLIVKTNNFVELNRLANGLYIINGKKVMVRK